MKLNNETKSHRLRLSKDEERSNSIENESFIVSSMNFRVKFIVVFSHLVGT